MHHDPLEEEQSHREDGHDNRYELHVRFVWSLLTILERCSNVAQQIMMNMKVIWFMATQKSTHLTGAFEMKCQHIKHILL